MCKGVGIRGSACNIDTPVISELTLKQTKLNFKIAIICRGKSLITDPLLIPTPSRISVTIRVIKKLYIHELLVI